MDLQLLCPPGFAIVAYLIGKIVQKKEILLTLIIVELKVFQKFIKALQKI